MKSSSCNTQRSKLKVLFVTPWFGDGGGERIWLNLLQNLNRSRFTPILAFCEHVESHFLCEMPEDVRIYDLNKRRRFAVDWPRLTLFLAQIIRKERPDIVVSLLHTWGFILHLARVLARVRFAIVINEHIHVSSSLNSLHRKRPVLSLASDMIHRYCYQHADLVIPVSHDVAKDLVLNYGAPLGKIKVIHNGIDLERIKRVAVEPVDHPWFSSDMPVIMGIGRLSEQKAFHILIKAFKKVLKIIPCKLVIVGEGEKRRELEALIKQLDLENHVVLLGRQSNPFKYLSRANVFVLSSVGEALPTVILEAMVLGIPIVSTRCPCGPEELLGDGKYGILVPVGDVDAMAEGILQILKNPSLRSSLSSRCTEKIRQFDLDSMVRAYESCFRELIYGTCQVQAHA